MPSRHKCCKTHKWPFLLIFTTKTHAFLHKAHLANLVLQDCALNCNNKVKLLMYFRVFALVFGGRQDDCR
jgi:hypothetical protein